MDKFLNRSAPQFRHALLDEVFNRLHIVVGHALEGFDFLCICFGKRGVNRPEILQCLRFKLRQIQRGSPTSAMKYSTSTSTRYFMSPHSER